MADRPPSADTDDDTGSRPEPRSTTGAPRWVKVSLIIVAVLILSFVILTLAGIGGDHGPGRHGPGGGAPPSSVIEPEGHTPPPGIQHGG